MGVCGDGGRGEGGRWPGTIFAGVQPLDVPSCALQPRSWVVSLMKEVQFSALDCTEQGLLKLWAEEGVCYIHSAAPEASEGSWLHAWWPGVGGGQSFCLL